MPERREKLNKNQETIGRAEATLPTIDRSCEKSKIVLAQDAKRFDGKRKLRYNSPGGYPEGDWR
jgi:hypothetical protein